MNGFLTISEISKHLEVHYRTVINWIKSGQLRAYKAGRQYRIKTTDLQEFMGITDLHAEAVEKAVIGSGQVGDARQKEE